MPPAQSKRPFWDYLYGMYTVGSAFYHLKDTLVGLYDDREAVAISHDVMEYITGLGKTDRLISKERTLASEELTKYEEALNALRKGIPLQYVTGIAWFMGKQYIVNKHVLIPRPETEELVQWIAEDYALLNSVFKILDVGTGSGCIPISLKLLLPMVMVTSCDISSNAISVAQKNADRLKADVGFVELDFLDGTTGERLGAYDVIVSNPPYIPLSEKARMHINVTENEPGIALFVPDDDALVFYRAIATFGKTHLNRGGRIYCELDEAHAEETKILFENEGYPNVVLKKDMHGNQRMLRVDGF